MSRVHVLVTGACGYKGSALVPKLIAAGHSVTAFDAMWFGDHLTPHPALTVVRGDLRDPDQLDLEGVDAVIHLASVANDPCGDLDPKLTWEVGCLGTMHLLEEARRRGVKRFIYASSGSVYGVKQEEQVTEDLSLTPISAYNKTKMCAERIALSYGGDMIVQIVRPATVCGWSPRMRLDVSVNLLTIAALERREIVVLGGDQIRPNIHIDDISDLYLFLLDHPEHEGVFNAGFENLSILEIAQMVKEEVDAAIVIKPSDDPRSYRMCSDRLLATGFRPKKKVRDAIVEMAGLYRQGALKDEDRWRNLRWMRRHVEGLERTV